MMHHPLPSNILNTNPILTTTKCPEHTRNSIISFTIINAQGLPEKDGSCWPTQKYATIDIVTKE